MQPTQILVAAASAASAVTTSVSAQPSVSQPATSANDAAPRTIAIMQIINVVNCDTINVVLGILILVFLNDEEVKAYYRS